MSRDSKGGSSKYAILTGGKTNKKPVKKSVRKTLKRLKGGASVHLTYDDEKYICHREETHEVDQGTPAVDDAPSVDETQKVLDSIKQVVEANSASAESQGPGDASETASSDNVTFIDLLIAL